MRTTPQSHEKHLVSLANRTVAKIATSKPASQAQGGWEGRAIVPNRSGNDWDKRSTLNANKKRKKPSSRGSMAFDFQIVRQRTRRQRFGDCDGVAQQPHRPSPSREQPSKLAQEHQQQFLHKLWSNLAHQLCQTRLKLRCWLR